MTEQQAMRMALEALEIAAEGGGVNFYEYAKELRQFLEQQPTDEPVAWVSTTELLVMQGNKQAGAKDWRINVGLVAEDGDVGLYTRTQPAAWVGLTDEEIQTIVNKVATGTYQTSDTFARAIEAALRSKNT